MIKSPNSISHLSGRRNSIRRCLSQLAFHNSSCLGVWDVLHLHIVIVIVIIIILTWIIYCPLFPNDCQQCQLNMLCNAAIVMIKIAPFSIWSFDSGTIFSPVVLYIVNLFMNHKLVSDQYFQYHNMDDMNVWKCKKDPIPLSPFIFSVVEYF